MVPKNSKWPSADALIAACEEVDVVTSGTNRSEVVTSCSITDCSEGMDPRGKFEELTEHGCFELDLLLTDLNKSELFETGSLTIIKNNEMFILTLNVRKAI